MREIYLNLNGQQVGPLTVEEVQEMQRSGQVGSECPAWSEGMAAWEPLHQVSPLPHSNPSIGNRKKAVLSVLGGALTCLLVGIGAVAKNGDLAKGLTSNASTIQNVLAQDQKLAHDTVAAIPGMKVTGDASFDTAAQITGSYVERARKIDLAGCPSDFSEAYYRHISAWSDMGTLLATHPHYQSGDEAVVEGFLRGLGGDITGGAFQKQDEYAAYGSKIEAMDATIKHSWEDVEAIAVRYGASPSP